MKWIKEAEMAYELSVEEAAERARADRPRLEKEEREALEFFDARSKEIYFLFDEILNELNRCGYVASLDLQWRTRPLMELPLGMRLHSTTHTKKVSGIEKPAYRCLSFEAGDVKVGVTVYLDGASNHHLVMEVSDSFLKKSLLLVDDPDMLDGDALQRVFVGVRKAIATHIAGGRYTAGSLM